MKKILLLLLLAGCEVHAPNPQEDCKEFDYRTRHDSKVMLCRMLWCVERPGTQQSMSGMAPLWCDEVQDLQQ